MNIQLNQEVLQTISAYTLPRYNEIPNVGLYLNQVAKYINEYMEPFCDMTITESMISNYVKKHLIASPVKKQYSREQIAYLLVIAATKTVLTMDNIQILFTLQKENYDTATAYNYFAEEFENILKYIFGLTPQIEEVGRSQSDVKMLCNDVIYQAVRKLYLDHCFMELAK